MGNGRTWRSAQYWAADMARAPQFAHLSVDTILLAFAIAWEAHENHYERNKIDGSSVELWDMLAVHPIAPIRAAFVGMAPCAPAYRSGDRQWDTARASIRDYETRKLTVTFWETLLNEPHFTSDSVEIIAKSLTRLCCICHSMTLPDGHFFWRWDNRCMSLFEYVCPTWRVNYRYGAPICASCGRTAKVHLYGAATERLDDGTCLTILIDLLSNKKVRDRSKIMSATDGLRFDPRRAAETDEGAFSPLEAA